MIFLSLRIYMKSIFGIRYTSAKSAIFTNLEALDFDFYEFLHFLNYEIYQIIELQSPKNGKMAVLELRDSPKLISCKIWMTEKSRNTLFLERHNFAKNFVKPTCEFREIK